MKPNNHMNIRQNRPKDHQGQRGLLVMRTCPRGELTLSNTHGTGRESPKYIKQKPKWETIIVCNWWVRWAKPSENTGPQGSTTKSFDCCQGSPGLLELHQEYSPGQTISIQPSAPLDHTGNCTQPWSELETSNSSMFSFLSHRIFGH